MKTPLKQTPPTYLARTNDRLFSPKVISEAFIKPLVVIALMALPLSAAEPRPGSLDLSFSVEIPIWDLPLDGSSVVEDIALAPDGKIYIGGHFSSVQSVSSDVVARLNADGSLD